MSEVYTCLRRTDIPNGNLQVLDLEPNESQRGLVYTTPGQTKYLQQPQNERVATHVSGADIAVSRTVKGVAAYLIDRVVSGGVAPGVGTGALTAANANTIASALVARMRTGAKMEVADVDTVIVATVVNTGLATGGSNGTLTDLLRILSGAEYVLPAGYLVQVGANKNAVNGGSFDTGKYRQLHDTSSFVLSNNVGRLSVLKSSSFEHKGTKAAAVVSYSETGLVL